MYRLPVILAATAALAAAGAAAQTQPARPTAQQPAPGAMPSASTMPSPASTIAAGTPNPTVGGAQMDASRTIVANASAAPNLSTLVSAVKAAGLEATLSGPGPFTVFAPTNEAFGRLAPGTVDTLLKPENKATLTKLLTYHVVPGSITLEQLKQQITAGGGKATLTTVEGSTLTVAAEGNAISLTDANNNKSYIEVPNVRQSNGVVHVVNGVVTPKLG